MSVLPGLCFCLSIFHFLSVTDVIKSVSTNLGVMKKRERILGSTFTVLQVNIIMTILT